jgi:DNA primase RepB-like protein
VRPQGAHNHFFTGLSYAVAQGFIRQLVATHQLETRGGAVVDNGKALDMLDAFASMGVRAFDVTMTDIRGDKIPRGFRANCGVDQLRRSIGPQLEASSRARENFIIRPRSAAARLIQLDDLPAEATARLAEYAFMVLCTSPGNFQAWVAVKAAPVDFARRLRKGAGADPSASGATRISGSLNFKTKYAPAFPLVEITEANPGRITTADELASAGLVAPAEEAPRRVSNRVSQPGRAGKSRRLRRFPELTHLCSSEMTSAF